MLSPCFAEVLASEGTCISNFSANPSFLAFKDRVAHGLQGCLLSECYLGTAWMTQQNLSQRFPADVAEENRGFLFRPLSPKQLCCIVLHCAMAEIQQLRDMGFAAAEAEVALREASGNVEQALELLLTGALRSDSPDESPKKTGSVSPKDSEWPELPKKPPPTPSSPSGYGKSDAKPPGLEQDDALGLSLEESFFAAQNLF